MRPDLRERSCRRCHGTGDDGPSLCSDCLGNGTVCPCHGQPECLDFDQRVAAETAQPAHHLTHRTDYDMADWRKCKGCGRVLALEEYEAGSDSLVCKSCAARSERPDRRRRSNTNQAEAVARWREKTNNAYGKAYAKARAEATAALVELHPGDFKELMDKARANHGLGPAR